MWLPWVKTRPSSESSCSGTSTSSSSTALAASASPRLSFSSPSLKDLQALLLSDAATPSPPLAAPCSPSSTVRVFHRVRVAASALRALRTLQSPPAGAGAASDADRRVVLYFTSLHVVRGTYEDCRAVRAILRGLRVAVDERDLAMDPRYLQELAALLPRLASPRRVALPQVFVGGRHLGGADEVRRLHEAGELRRVVAGAVAASPLAACGRCGGERYVLCGSCNGSHKRYSVKGGGGFRTCAGCNENGLVRCPDCSPPDV
ncbi:hypothetical protein BAE44_0007834 [Dichanthelium oligosanthes]|uniref:Glutaredoxin domain-containing protein n=1 Tax=Dichanthelium oligosanthes TaxID=888268 RepID=A0A1E5W166_9POAL|nr:hypothetical protein BAE44_0007834 [Dichanthelium oligosanthes]